MACNCKKNRTRVLTPKMLMRQRELEEQSNKEKESKEKEADINGQKD